MKIGPIDISYRMIIYTSLIVVEVIAVMTLWKANSEIRAESIYRMKVMRGLYDEKIEAVNESVEAAQSVIQFSPNRVDVRLYLGALQYRQKEFKAAQKTFEDAVAMSNATSQQKAWALCGAAASVYSAAGKDESAKALAEAEKLYKQASEIKFDGNKRSVDALAGLATLAYLKAGPNAGAEVLALTDEALNAADAPALKVLAQVYNVRGLVQARQGLALEAAKSFTQAQVLRPERSDFADNRRMARIGSLLDKSLSDQQRIDLLQKVDREVSAYGKNLSLAWTMMGCGWGSLKSDKDYMKGPYVKAMDSFQRAISSDQNDPRAYRAKAQLIEERIAEVASGLIVPISGFKGESPVGSIWAGGAVKIDSKDVSLRSELRQLLTDCEAVWQLLGDRATGADKIDARLRQLAAARRLYWLTPEQDTSARNAGLEKMQKLVNEIVALDPKNGQSLFTQGLVQFDKGDYSSALATMKNAKAAGCAQPEIDKLIEGLSVKPEVFDIRPGQNRRWFGTIPLISGSLRSTSTSYKAVKMTVDSKEVTPSIIGTQVLFVPEENFSLDGSHSVKVAVVDKFDNNVEFPEFEFGVDKKAPSIKVLPEEKSTVSTKPVWTITLSDASGVDASATRVVLKSVKAAQSMTRELVKDGKFKMGFPDLQPPVRAGTLAGESFRVAPGQELQPGEYALEISTTDINGNATTETKTYTVK